MKSLLISIISLTVAFANLQAGPPVTTQSDTNKLITNELENDLTAKAFDVTVYGTMAPKLAASGAYGAGLSLTHPITNYGFVGIRFDLLGKTYTAGTFGGGLKAPFNVYGHQVVPYAGTGVKDVLSSTGVSTGQVSASVYTGVTAELYTNSTKTVHAGVMAEMEYDSAYAGVQIFHGGVFGKIEF